MFSFFKKPKLDKCARCHKDHMQDVNQRDIMKRSMCKPCYKTYIYRLEYIKNKSESIINGALSNAQLIRLETAKKRKARQSLATNRAIQQNTYLELRIA